MLLVPLKLEDKGVDITRLSSTYDLKLPVTIN